MNSDQRPQGPKPIKKPEKVVVTGGMPYANGPIHLGHLAGALVPPDILARYMRMLIGQDNVLFVSGNDDHGSTSELTALQKNIPLRQMIDTIHKEHLSTLDKYSIQFDTFSGTSQPEAYEIHKNLCQEFIRKLHKNGLLIKKTSKQWYDPKLNRFLQDRFVNGKCPNPKCENTQAYSDQCDKCDAKYDPTELQNPRSTLSDAVPELRDTTHWWLDMWKVSEPLRIWLQGKSKSWRPAVLSEALGTVLPSLAFSNVHEESYKGLKIELPKHKSKYAAGKKVQLQFETKVDLESAQKLLQSKEIPSELVDSWAHRSISRDVAWGIPMPVDLDPDMAGKTFYVWPDSLIAPISFTQVALKSKGKDVKDFEKFWKNPEARICQFLGQDNVYFYVLMQGAMWIGSQSDITRLPLPGEFQLNDVFGSYHLWVNGEKMSKSTGNFFTGDQLVDDMKFGGEEVRYFIATLSLSDKNSNFDLKVLEEKMKFLAGPMNAAFEKPIAACQSKFAGKVPAGKLLEKVEQETQKILQRYAKDMDRADYPVLLNLIENYARQINSLFTQFKPHDDRHDETERKDALYSCFYVLKNLMIMLYPFAPKTMDRVRESLKLPANVFRVEELGSGISPGHQIGEKQNYFANPPGACDGAFI